MKLIFILTDCSSPSSYFSCLGLLTPTSYLLNCLSNRYFHWPLFLLASPNTCVYFYCLIFHPRDWNLYVHPWPSPASCRTKLYWKGVHDSPLQECAPLGLPPVSSILLLPNSWFGAWHFRCVLRKFFIEWVSELFPLGMLLFCLYHPHFI